MNCLIEADIYGNVNSTDSSISDGLSITVSANNSNVAIVPALGDDQRMEECTG